jgi:Prokaryotic E2 family E
MSLVPQKDELYLRERGFNFELKQGTNEVYLVIHGWEFPAAYNSRVADVLIIIPPSYPLNKLDMFWTIPDIKLAATGAWPEAAAEHQTYDGKTWQRWSRHVEEWRPGVDSLRTFIAAITSEINRGV